MAISAARTKVIHLAKRQLALGETDYREILQSAAGVTSSKELDEVGFDAVMTHLERLGFRSVKRPTPAGRRAGMATPRQIGKIRGLWKAYSGADDETQLERWLEANLRASSLRFLDAHKAGAVVGILERMIAKRRAKAESADPHSHNEKSDS